jgi:hypothetical protein
MPPPALRIDIPSSTSSVTWANLETFIGEQVQTCLRRVLEDEVDERIESRILPLFERRTAEVAKLLPALYLHGLSSGDFTLPLRGLLGASAPLRATSVQRLTGDWQCDDGPWRTQDLSALADGSTVVLAVESGHRQSRESWAAILRDLTPSGLPLASIVRWKLFTRDASLVVRRAGALSVHDRATCRKRQPIGL